MDRSRRDQLVNSLKDRGVILTGSHVVYTSGRHGSDYFKKNLIYADPLLVADLCGEIALHFYQKEIEYDVVVGPANGGIILAQWTAYNTAYNNWNHKPGSKFAQALYVEEIEEEASLLWREYGQGYSPKKRFVFCADYAELIKGKRVLLVDDVLTTGGTIELVIEAINEAAGKLVGVGIICDRRLAPEQLPGVPELFSVLEIPMKSWSEEDCPKCKAGVPVNTNVGKGANYVASRR